MIIIETKKFIFKKKSIWFSERPFEIKNCDIAVFYACKNKVDMDGFICEYSPTIIVDLLQDENTLWQNISSSTKNYINRTSREGIEIKINEDFNEFKRLYYNFVRKKNFEIGDESLDIIKQYGTLFTAYKDSEMLCGLLTIEDELNIRIFAGGSKRLMKDKKMANVISWANRAIIWEAIKYGKRKGYRKFDLGGYYLGKDKNDPRYKINLFKKSFGGEVVIYYKYMKYYSSLYRFSKKIFKKIKKAK